MINKLLLIITLIYTLNLNAEESFFDSLKHKTSNILGSAKDTVDEIDTQKIETNIKNTYDKTKLYILRINDNNSTKQLKEKTINGYNKLKIFTKESIEYSKNKLECLSK